MAPVIPPPGLRRALAGFLFGSIGAAIAYSPIGRISGAHINPAMTLAFWLEDKLKWRDALAYVLAQCAGAISAPPVSSSGARWRWSLDEGATLPGEPAGAPDGRSPEKPLRVSARRARLRAMAAGKTTRPYTPLVNPVLVLPARVARGAHLRRELESGAKLWPGGRERGHGTTIGYTGSAPVSARASPSLPHASLRWRRPAEGGAALPFRPPRRISPGGPEPRGEAGGRSDGRCRERRRRAPPGNGGGQANRPMPSKPAGGAGGPISASANGGRCERITAPDGKAWEYFPHDHARSRAYRWGEDGIAGFSDEKLSWCLALALWNGRDPFIKERMFGLTNAQGNHGEDVKEMWWYLDATPTPFLHAHALQVPAGAFPYDELVAENGSRRGHAMPEYELIDTGRLRRVPLFRRHGRICQGRPRRHRHARHRRELRAGRRRPVHACRILGAQHMVVDRGRAAASATPRRGRRGARDPSRRGRRCASRPLQPAEWLFCENETNTRRLFGTRRSGHFKDAINDYVVHGDDSGAQSHARGHEMRGAVAPRSRAGRAGGDACSAS